MFFATPSLPYNSTSDRQRPPPAPPQLELNPALEALLETLHLVSSRQSQVVFGNTLWTLYRRLDGSSRYSARLRQLSAFKFPSPHLASTARDGGAVTSASSTASELRPPTTIRSSAAPLAPRTRHLAPGSFRSPLLAATRPTTQPASRQVRPGAGCSSSSPSASCASSRSRLLDRAIGGRIV